MTAREFWHMILGSIVIGVCLGLAGQGLLHTIHH